MKGHVIGRYRVTRKLGEGGMAEVYLAKHELMDRYAAVKLLLPEMSAREDIVRRFFQEAQAAARIDHPGIVHVFDVGRAPGGRAFLAMEALSGESLGRRLRRRKRLPLASAILLIRQLAGVIGAAHRRGIIHRDLKPDNIFLVPDPEMPCGERVKVLDFGLAKLLDGAVRGAELTAQGAVFGTPAYMAPEQCRSAATVDARTDLYAIGCVFYACLCGLPPFGPGGVEVLLAHVGQAPVPPRARAASIPPEVDALILRLLAKDPDQRLPSCEALIAELDRVVAAAPDLARSMTGMRGAPAAGSQATTRGRPAIDQAGDREAEPAQHPRAVTEGDLREGSGASAPRARAALPVDARPRVPCQTFRSLPETRNLRARAQEPGAPVWTSCRPGMPSSAQPPAPGESGAMYASRETSPTIGNGEIDLASGRDGSRRVLWSLVTTGLLGGLVATGLAVSASGEKADDLVPATHGLAADAEQREGEPRDRQARAAGGEAPAADIDELLAQAERSVSERAWGEALRALRRASEHEGLCEHRRARVSELERKARAGQAREAGGERRTRSARQARGSGRAATRAAAGERKSGIPDILAHIQSAYRRGNTALAFDRCRHAPERAAGHEQLAAFCGFVACKVEDAQAARQYYARASMRRHRSWIAQTCLKAGFDIQR